MTNTDIEKIKIKLRQAINAIGELMACYPEGSEEVKSLESARGLVLDVVLGHKVSEANDSLTKQLYELVGQNVDSRLKSAIANRQTANRMAELLESEAMLKSLTKQSPG